MTTLLRQAFDEAAKLPEAEQNLLASRLLAELAAQDDFDRAIARTGTNWRAWRGPRSPTTAPARRRNSTRRSCELADHLAVPHALTTARINKV